VAEIGRQNLDRASANGSGGVEINDSIESLFPEVLTSRFPLAHRALGSPTLLALFAWHFANDYWQDYEFL
jgi:hypothetical protein